MAANRGKTLEKDFKTLCDAESVRARFSYHRFPDAMSGSFTVAPADFLIENSGATKLVECKETQYPSRIPYQNFRADQVARMRKWKQAGMQSKVIIHHTKGGGYRLIDIDFFVERDLSKGSWFFTEPAQFKTLQEVFIELLK